MGYDIYINKEKASAVGIEARVVGTIDKRNIYGIFVDGKVQDCTNIWVCDVEIGWRSGPTDIVYERLKPGDYNESW